MLTLANHIREEAKRCEEELKVDLKQIVPDSEKELKDIYAPL